ncbi:uncharacterized protein V6R79_019918 [Siganus canaliculatus]
MNATIYQLKFDNDWLQFKWDAEIMNNKHLQEDVESLKNENERLRTAHRAVMQRFTDELQTERTNIFR